MIDMLYVLVDREDFNHVNINLFCMFEESANSEAIILRIINVFDEAVKSMRVG